MRSPLVTPAVVDAWLDTLRPEQQPLARALRRVVLDAAPALVPVVKWGNLVFTLRGRHALAVVIHKDHAQLQVFNGAALAAKHPGLEGAGRDARHLKLGYVEGLDEARIRELARDAVDSMR